MHFFTDIIKNNMSVRYDCGPVLRGIIVLKGPFGGTFVLKRPVGSINTCPQGSCWR